VLERLSTLAEVSPPTISCTHAFLALLITGLTGAALLGSKRVGRRPPPSVEPSQHALWLATVFSLAVVFVLAVWLAVLAGYISLGFILSWQMLSISAVGGSLYLLSRLQHDFFHALLNPDGLSGRRLRAAFHIQPAALEQASTVLSAVGRLSLLLVALGAVLTPFGGSLESVFAHVDEAFNELKVGALIIRPEVIFNATLVLVLGAIAVRIARRWLAKQLLPKTKLSAGMQNSIITLLSYVAMVIVLALSLRTANVSPESLTWIASALSVGIGFGLQAIVSNFICGLILLAERPVKVGDRVSMSDVEGDVRRINVRATEIQLDDGSVMIVPNAQFITQNLRNVTPSNALGKVTLSLPMPLDTDVEKVLDVVLEALQAHPATLDEPAPISALCDITTSAIALTGTAYVSNPRETYIVRSALLLDIVKRLVKAQLPLAMTQNSISPSPAYPGGHSPPVPKSQ
jgi:potassium-dependent mechanosensitive channel